MPDRDICTDGGSYIEGDASAGGGAVCGDEVAACGGGAGGFGRAGCEGQRRIDLRRPQHGGYNLWKRKMFSRKS
jgi:hypothetical protein